MTGERDVKIVVFEAEHREVAAFEALAGSHELAVTEKPLRSDNAAEFADADVVSTFVYSAPDRPALEQLLQLKLVATRSTGFDHIDTAYCAAHRVTVSNVPSYGENTVAEHVFALLLALSHRLPEAIERAQRGHFSPEGLQGFDLAGKVLGVIGTGSIGRHVVRIAKGFGMEVVAVDIVEDARFARSADFRYVALDELWRLADVITLHVPSLPETRRLLSPQAFARMKDGVVIINTARGDLIDTRALIQALTSGKVAAAGLDVLPDEPMIREEAELICSFFCDQYDLRNLVANHVLLRMPNVIVTPHSAFNTREAVDRIVSTTVENIRGFLAGTPQNVVAGPTAS
jgi:D-lactate dehydrogenase